MHTLVHTLSLGRRLWPVASFTGAYLVIALLVGLWKANTEFLFYIGVVAVLTGVVWWVDRAIGGISTGALWALSLWGLAHMAGGLLTVPGGWPVENPSRVLYTLWIIPDRLKYDHIVHAYGFGTTTWVCWQGLRAAFRRRGARLVPGFGVLVLAVTAGLGFGALNELVEFVAVLTIPETNVGGYVNTGWDLVANAVGATTAAALIWWFDKDGTAAFDSPAA